MKPTETDLSVATGQDELEDDGPLIGQRWNADAK